MKSEKTGNKQENRGRKPLENKSIQVSWRIPHEIYQLLEAEQKKIESVMGCEVPLSKVLQGIIKKSVK